MSYKLSRAEAQKVFEKLLETYEIYAPKKFKNQGRYSAQDITKYDKVKSIEEVEYEKRSTYPMKEVLSPIQQALFYFTEDEYRESKVSNKPILIFARPCDINAMKIQEKIYMQNGAKCDYYYNRMHERVKYILMECNGGQDTCFCVSMGTNTTDNYALAVRFNKDEILFEVKEEGFEPYFKDAAKADFKPEFVKENQLKVTMPEIKDRDELNALKAHPMWKEFDKRCISCGACTIACSTCTCFTTKDITYGDNPEVGERRRISSSCQIADFATVAGGGTYRKTAGERMAYKMIHKFHAYKERFGERHMCVGCGRCTERCPECISISHTLRKMNDALKEIKEGK